MNALLFIVATVLFFVTFVWLVLILLATYKANKFLKSLSIENEKQKHNLTFVQQLSTIKFGINKGNLIFNIKERWNPFLKPKVSFTAYIPMKNTHVKKIFHIPYEVISVSEMFDYYNQVSYLIDNSDPNRIEELLCFEGFNFSISAKCSWLCKIWNNIYSEKPVIKLEYLQQDINISAKSTQRLAEIDYKHTDAKWNLWVDAENLSREGSKFVKSFSCENLDECNPRALAESFMNDKVLGLYFYSKLSKKEKSMETFFVKFYNLFNGIKEPEDLEESHKTILKNQNLVLLIRLNEGTLYCYLKNDVLVIKIKTKDGENSFVYGTAVQAANDPTKAVFELNKILKSKEVKAA